LDVGLDHPQPQELQTEIQIYVPNSGTPPLESANADLEKAQRAFAEALKEDEGDAIVDNASDDIRVYRSGQLPAVGKPTAKRLLSDQDAKTIRTPRGAGTSNPTDLAYEYGEFASERDDVTQRGIYLCIWRLESDGAWKIALDLQKSAPAQKK
jgi:ketosteroid isomerase-like protein